MKFQRSVWERPGRDPHDRSPEALYRWNFTAMLLDSGGFQFAIAFLSPFTFIPLFLSNLTDLAILIGAAPSIYLLGLHVPQVFFANIVYGFSRRKGYILVVALIERVALAGMFGFAALALSAPRVALVGFLASYAILTLSLGAIIPAYVDFVARTLVRRRGLYYGLNYLLAGVLGVGGAWIAGGLLDALGDLRGLVWSFGIALGVTCVSFIATLSLKEPAGRLPLRRRPWREYWSYVREVVVAERDFTKFVVARSVLGLGEMAGPLYAVYGLAVLGLPGRVTAVWTMVLTAAYAVGNLLWGVVGERFGFKRVLLLAAGCQGSAAALALSLPTEAAFLAIFGLVGAALAGNQIVNMNMAIDYAPPGESPVFSGILHAGQAPSVVAAPVLGGLIADVWSPATTFLLTALSVVIGIAVLSLVRFEGRPTYKPFPTEA